MPVVVVVEEFENKTLKDLGIKFGDDLSRLINELLEAMASSGDIDFHEATSVILTVLSSAMVGIARQTGGGTLAADFVETALREITSRVQQKEAAN
jgi:hypothetical protein